jgi:prolyl-tRNA synthetase
MLMSKSFSPTLRQIPAEAEIASHKLSLRAGLVRKNAAGLYTYLPLGYRVIQKIMKIIRKELDGIGCQELMLPILQPAELWHQSGRWDGYGAEMFKVKDRNERQFCLGPTHEEIITDLVKGELNSYKQLPVTLYQMQNKYRDEIRPRFGVIRGREFIMKDAYSFHVDEESLDKTYWEMYQAYARIFDQCGLKTLPVEADSGTIGGDQTHEFMVLASIGEAEIVHCEACGYAANVEKADCVATGWPYSAGNGPNKSVHTPNIKSVQDLSGYLSIRPGQIIKTLIYLADDKPVAALIRGDRQLNEIKLQKVLRADQLQPADDAAVSRITNAPVGFAGPIGLKGVTIVADLEVEKAKNAVVGGNQADTHLVGVDWGKDFTADIIADIRLAQKEDLCPACRKSELKSSGGIEVGQVFKLGTKYSVKLSATFKGEDGQERPYIMGCYGIGISRTMAAIIEQHHDENGIIWPVKVAPYYVVILLLDPEDDQLKSLALDLYHKLWENGYETVLDERNERPGVKFKDADLVGYPLRINIGKRSMQNGVVELKMRRSGEEIALAPEEVIDYIKEYLKV